MHVGALSRRVFCALRVWHWLTLYSKPEVLPLRHCIYLHFCRYLQIYNNFSNQITTKLKNVEIFFKC